VAETERDVTVLVPNVELRVALGEGERDAEMELDGVKLLEQEKVVGVGEKLVDRVAVLEIEKDVEGVEVRDSVPEVVGLNVAVAIRVSVFDGVAEPLVVKAVIDFVAVTETVVVIVLERTACVPVAEKEKVITTELVGVSE
jgi:hypothetical protein